jgi:hypothetical protein
MRFFLATFLALTLTLHADEAELRHELEHNFSQWRAAIAAHNLADWQRTTATFRQVMTRNIIVSQKHPYPQALFDFPLRAPEVATLQYLKAVAKGPTANLIYFGKVDLGIPDAEVPENLLVLQFINESGQWKFDTLRLVNLADAPEVRTALKNGVTGGILDEPDFQPDGVAPEIPKLCHAPDYIAALQVTALGYAVTSRVNGFALPTVADRAEQHLIVGGLRDGENSLSMDIKPTPVAEGSARHLDVNAVILTNDPAKPAIRVFNWHPESNIPAVSDQTIFVNKITLRGG